MSIRLKVLKILVISLVLILLISFFTSCVKKSKAPELTIFTSLGEDEWQVFREHIFPPFEKKYNCKINAIQVEPDDAINKLYAMKQAQKQEADIVCQDNMRLVPLIEMDLIEDLTNLQISIPQTVIPSLLKICKFDNKFYFAPYRPNVEITFYNEKKFKQYNLKPPANWDELLATAKFFKETEGIGRVAIKGGLTDDTTCHLFDFILSAGGDPLKVNDLGCIKAFTFLQELWIWLSPASKKATWESMNKFLADDSVYLGQNWPFAINILVDKNQKKEIKAYSGWKGPVREAHTLGGEVIGIAKGSKHKELALNYINYIMSREVQSLFISKLSWPAIRTDVYAKVAPEKESYFKAIKKALSRTYPRPNISYWEDLDKILNQAFLEVVIQQKPVKLTLDKYAEKLNLIKQKKLKKQSAVDSP